MAGNSLRFVIVTCIIEDDRILYCEYNLIIFFRPVDANRLCLEIIRQSPSPRWSHGSGSWDKDGFFLLSLGFRLSMTAQSSL